MPIGRSGAVLRCVLSRCCAPAFRDLTASLRTERSVHSLLVISVDRFAPTANHQTTWQAASAQLRLADNLRITTFQVRWCLPVLCTEYFVPSRVPRCGDDRGGRHLSPPPRDDAAIQQGFLLHIRSLLTTLLRSTTTVVLGSRHSATEYYSATQLGSAGSLRSTLTPKYPKIST